MLTRTKAPQAKLQDGRNGNAATCGQCGRPLRPKRSSHRQRFCSPACKKAANRQRSKEGRTAFYFQKRLYTLASYNYDSKRDCKRLRFTEKRVGRGHCQLHGFSNAHISKVSSPTVPNCRIRCNLSPKKILVIFRQILVCERCGVDLTQQYVRRLASLPIAQDGLTRLAAGRVRKAGI
jgi:hypothetical protein